MSATTEHPKVFISYSWTSVEHEQFVMDLATSLCNHGVDAILDKWDLKPGQDKYVFMESMVVDTEVSPVPSPPVPSSSTTQPIASTAPSTRLAVLNVVFTATSPTSPTSAGTSPS